MDRMQLWKACLQSHSGSCTRKLSHQSFQLQIISMLKIRTAL